MTFVVNYADKLAIRAHFIPKMRSMSESNWAYWSMDQDGWEEDLVECMDTIRFLLFMWDCEEQGCYPTEAMADYLAELEVEVYGHVVCE